MENEQQNTPNKSGKKATIITYSLIAVGAIVLGVTAGVVLKRVFGQTQVDYEGFNPDAFKMDAKKLVSDYDKNPRANFTPAELINIGLEKYRECENSYSFGYGIADTVVKQTIRNAQIKNGNHYFEESISRSSMVAIANRVTQEKDGNNINLYKGKAIETETGQYKDNKITYNCEDYKTNWGKTLDEMFIYLISNDTVLKEGSSVVKKDDQTIVTVMLNKDIATYYYKYQMKSISNLDSLPTFTSLKHVYTFDKNMMLLTCSVDEVYAASMGIKASIHNIIDYYYFANEYLEIPSLDEQVNYSIKGDLNNEKETA